MRVGVVVPKFGHTAVERNRLKRRLRELVRDQLLPLARGCDVVIWALPPAYRQTFEQLAVTLRTVVDRMGDCHASVS